MRITRDSYWLVYLGLRCLDIFEKYSDMSEEEFLDYMDANNIWSIFESKDSLWMFMQAGIVEIVLVLGRWLPVERQEQIVENYNKAMGTDYKLELE